MEMSIEENTKNQRDSANKPNLRIVPGDEFGLDLPAEPPSIWGTSSRSLWVEGEPLYLAGAPGSGKTTLIHHVILARAGLRTRPVLGLPVKSSDQRILLIASDRPRQSQRGFNRMVEEADRDGLSDRLTVVWGPLTFRLDDLTQTTALTELAEKHAAGTVIIDSLSSVASGLAQDEGGSSVNLAIGHTCASGIEVAVIHHTKKARPESPSANGLDDVYGSRWLTSGAGSVVVLAKDQNDVVKVRQWKAPFTPVGPMTFSIDYETGAISASTGREVMEILESEDAEFTVREVTVRWFRTESPSDGQLERARRALRKAVRDGMAVEKTPENGKAYTYRAAKWAEESHGGDPHDFPHEIPREEPW